MKNYSKHTVLFVVLTCLLLVLLLLNISLGQISIPFKEVLKSLTGSQASKETWEYIIFNYRLPKAITAILVGIGLSVAGLLMQTLFRNPLAGPYVLGLSAGSSLGVAFVILASGCVPVFLSSILTSSYGIVLASCLGSFVVLILVLIVSQKLRDTNSILIVGLMFASFASAIVGILTYFSSAEQLQKYTFWSMGNIGNLTWNTLILLAVLVFVGLLLSVYSIKSLNAMLLGENYAKSLGLNYQKSRFIIILATSILSGSITAFVGPIAFIGLAVPHMAKIIFQTSNHYILFFSTLLLGAITLLFCDIFSQIPGTEIILPINAVTSIIGAPVVIYLLVRKQKMLL